MNKHAYFYNSDNGDREYDADSLTDWLLPFFTTGIFNGQLQVTANDNMTITVSGGYCNIAGKVKHFVSATTFDLETASGTLNRIDNVILRRDDTQRDIYLMIQKGSNAQTPTSPELTRNGTIHDLKLAEIYINAGTIAITQANITDKRMDKSVCGWVASTVKEIDLSQLPAQFEAKFNEWFKTIDGQLSKDAAGNLLNLIEVERARIDNLTKMKEGSTTGDAELQDLRVGANGEVYETAGLAVRTQFRNATAAITQNTSTLVEMTREYNFIPITLSDNRIYNHYLYLTTNVTEESLVGKKISDAITWEVDSSSEKFVTYLKSMKKGDSLVFSNALALYPPDSCPYVIVTNRDDFIIDAVSVTTLNTTKVYTLKEDGNLTFSFRTRGISGVGECFYIKEKNPNEPVVLDADLTATYETDAEIGEATLRAIMEGKQILVRTPNADGGNYTAVYSPVYMYQLPNYMNSYLYLFYLRDEKQTLDLSALGMGTIQLPTYGELKLKLSRDYNQTPLL